ncbi:MFS transporter [Marinicrinis sediminis]|uniref:MFS transporter n=1 Tax=Marinicrinis sediminis TaxID=1652465 RepID=A0ABW5RCH1_9BACL
MDVKQSWGTYTLLSCLFLGLFTEVLLAPYYPQFFSQVFGLEGYAFIGLYLFVCRLVVVMFSPIWGWLSRYVEAKQLLLIGQAGTAWFTFMLASAENETQFLWLTVALLLFKSSYMLIYPLIIEQSGASQMSHAAAKFHAVYHLAVVMSTLAGAWMMELNNPLQLFYWAAVVDVLQLVLCLFVFKKVLLQRPGKKVTEETASSTHPDSQIKAMGKRSHFIFMCVLGGLFFTITILNNVIRPFFTTYIQDAFSLSIQMSGLLFLLPSILAIASMPFIRKFCVPAHVHSVYGIGLIVMVIGLFLQAIPHVGWMLLGRLMYGAFLAMTMAALDMYLFQRFQGRRLSFYFSMIVSFQTAGELVSPLLASVLVEQVHAVAPLVAASLIGVLNFLIFLTFRRELKGEKKIATEVTSLEVLDGSTSRSV